MDPQNECEIVYELAELNNTNDNDKTHHISAPLSCHRLSPIMSHSRQVRAPQHHTKCSV